jgi:serine phosphatase RsbU (regulator of sigma subunit)
MIARRQTERALDRARDELQIAKREMEIARQIQTALLPRVVDVPGFEVAAVMRPAEEVGGDYYDVRPLDDGGWIAIGDVSGHGLDAGLVMMMIQVAVASLVQETPGDVADVARVVTALNRVIYENVHDRMQLSKHATFSLLRLFSDGRVLVAGAHEELLVLRKQSGACERIPTAGAWLGILPDVTHCVTAASHRLDRGDVLLLHTDGIPEAASKTGELFGKDRLERLLLAGAERPMTELCEAAVRDALGFATPQADDMTVVAIRRV